MLATKFKQCALWTQTCYHWRQYMVIFSTYCYLQYGLYQLLHNYYKNCYTVIPLYCDIAEYFLFVFFICILRYQIFLLWIIHFVLSFKYTCLCRCEVFVVACGTVGCLCDNPRGAGGYEIVTMTTLFSVFNKSSTSLRRNCCRLGEVFVAGCTGNCHAGNFQCGRLRKLSRNGDFIGISFLVANVICFTMYRL